MSKLEQVLIYSIQPEHMLNILNGNKTIEVRKRNLPQWAKEALAQGEVVEGYGYCTKGGKRLAYEKQPKHPYYILSNSDGVNSGNGKVVVKFEVSGVEKIPFIDSEDWVLEGYYDIQPHDIPLKACLDIRQLNSYGNGADLYAHHLTNIQPIEPMEIGEFYKHDYTYVEQKELPCERVMKQDGYLLATYDIAGLRWVIEPNKLTKAPQSFMTAWVKGVVE